MNTKAKFFKYLFVLILYPIGINRAGDSPNPPEFRCSINKEINKAEQSLVDRLSRWLKRKSDTSSKNPKPKKISNIGPKTMSTQQLENEMKELASIDPQLNNVKIEGRYYSLMAEYAKRIQRHNDIDSLIKAGLLRLENGHLISDYIMSYTHLGVLTLEDAGDGTVRVLANRGTPYFRGIDSPAFGGHIQSAKSYMKSDIAKDVFEKENIVVVVAVPKEEVERLGVDPNGEVFFTENLLVQAKGIRIFGTKINSGIEILKYEAKIKKPTRNN